PPSWSSGLVDLKFQAVGGQSDAIDLSGNPVPQTECDGCLDNNSFTLGGVNFIFSVPDYTISTAWATVRRPAAMGGPGYTERCSLAPGDAVPGGCATAGKCLAPLCAYLQDPVLQTRQFIASAPIAEDHVHVLPPEKYDVSGLAQVPYMFDPTTGKDAN